MKRLNLIILCLLLGIGSAIAQTLKVEGKIVEETGGPIVGATIMIKGTTQGVTSDVDGNFTIVVPNNQAVLVVSFVGYEKQEVKVKPTLKIVMKESSQTLDEVVVTGMNKIDKRLFTGASDRLTAEDVKMDGLPEISRALEGRSAGVSVQNVSGTFGSAPKIRIRGATSIYGSSKPLWVVDGVIMEDVTEVDADALSSGDAVTLISSAIAGLNADDIESFQILKDGSATSIYGARAMAGVIVVTTKRGKAGVSRINYTGEFTVRMKPGYDEFNIMNSQEQMGVYQELQQKGWLNFSNTYRASNSGVYGKMYQLLNTYDPQTGQFALQNTIAARNAYLRKAEMRNTDWFDHLFSNSMMMNHSISMTSGTEKSSYYASMSVMTDPGWTEQSKVSRYTFNLNTLYNIYPSLSLNMIGNASYRKQRAPGTLSQTVDAVNGEVKRDFDINPYSYAINTSRTLEPNTFYTRNYAPFNILHELKNNYMELNVTDLRFQGELKWKVLQGLELSALGAVKYSTTSQEHHIKDESNQAMAYREMPDATVRDNNPFLYSNPDDPYALPITVLPEGGIYEKTDYRMLSYDFRAALSWNHVFNETHIVNFYGSMEVNSTERRKNWFRGWGMQYAMGEVPFYAYEVFKRGVEEGSNYYTMNNTRSRIAAFASNATYSYKGKYTLNGTFRYEGSNQLGKSRDARWLPTWNIAGSWNAHEETFFESFKPVLSNLTMRASYSLTAERGPTTNSLPVFRSASPWRPYTGIQETGLSIESLENSELTYEKKHELNIGVDAGFIDNRINMEFAWYKRNGFDLIGEVTTMGIGGQITKFANVAEMKSYGIEFTLSTQNIRLRDFKWNTDFIFSYNKNKVTQLETKKRVIDLITGNTFTRQGYAVRSLFSIPFERLDDRGFPVFMNENGEQTINDVNFQERDKLDFLHYEGPTEPTISGSFGNIFTYKNLKLNVFMTYSFGNKIRLDPVFHNRYTDLEATPKEFKNRWIMPGDERHTRIPTIATYRQNRDIDNLSVTYNAYNYSTERVADGGFIRMKEISLSYDFPKRWIDRLGFNSLSLKVQGTNLFLLYADDKLNGQDPEFFRSGGVAAPVPKQYTFTIRLGL